MLSRLRGISTLIDLLLRRCGARPVHKEMIDQEWLTSPKSSSVFLIYLVMSDIFAVKNVKYLSACLQGCLSLVSPLSFLSLSLSLSLFPLLSPWQS